MWEKAFRRRKSLYVWKVWPKNQCLFSLFLVIDLIISVSTVFSIRVNLFTRFFIVYEIQCYITLALVSIENSSGHTFLVFIVNDPIFKRRFSINGSKKLKKEINFWIMKSWWKINLFSKRFNAKKFFNLCLGSVIYVWAELHIKRLRKDYFFCRKSMFSTKGIEILLLKDLTSIWLCFLKREKTISVQNWCLLSKKNINKFVVQNGTWHRADHICRCRLDDSAG